MHIIKIILATFYLTIQIFFPSNSKFISPNSVFCFHHKIIIKNMLLFNLIILTFFSSNSQFISCNCEYISHSWEKKSELLDKVTISFFNFISWQKRSSIDSRSANYAHSINNNAFHLYAGHLLAFFFTIQSNLTKINVLKGNAHVTTIPICLHH